MILNKTFFIPRYYVVHIKSLLNREGKICKVGLILWNKINPLYSAIFAVSSNPISCPSEFLRQKRWTDKTAQINNLRQKLGET